MVIIRLHVQLISNLTQTVYCFLLLRKRVQNTLIRELCQWWTDLLRIGVTSLSQQIFTMMKRFWSRFKFVQAISKAHYWFTIETVLFKRFLSMKVMNVHIFGWPMRQVSMGQWVDSKMYFWAKHEGANIRALLLISFLIKSNLGRSVV